MFEELLKKYSDKWGIEVTHEKVADFVIKNITPLSATFAGFATPHALYALANKYDMSEARQNHKKYLEGEVVLYEQSIENTAKEISAIRAKKYISEETPKNIFSFVRKEVPKYARMLEQKRADDEKRLQELSKKIQDLEQSIAECKSKIIESEKAENYWELLRDVSLKAFHDVCQKYPVYTNITLDALTVVHKLYKDYRDADCVSEAATREFYERGDINILITVSGLSVNPSMDFPTDTLDAILNIKEVDHMTRKCIMSDLCGFDVFSAGGVYEPIAAYS